WNTSRASLPMALVVGGSGVVNGHLFVIGGADSTGTPVSTVYDYDIAGNTWTTRAAVPIAVADPGSAVVRNQVIIFGGGTPFHAPGAPANARQIAPNALANTQIFDTSGYTWSSGPNLNVARSLTTGARVGTYLVAVAGFDGASNLSSVEASVL